MVTALYTHSIHQQHLVVDQHPECPERLQVIEQALEATEFADLARFSSQPVEHKYIELAHSEECIALLENIVPHDDGRLVSFDNETYLSKQSLQASLHAAGAACAAIDLLHEGKADNAFCAVRPPGHHSTRTLPMGFCLINSIAVAACYALERHAMQRVAIIDFDVHHGNGTQDIFYRQPSVLFASSHQSPLYPGSGSASETGVGNVLNVPLAAGSDGKVFRRAYTEVIFPRLTDFQPDLILVSAGFDAHRLDPLAGLNLEESDYAWVTTELMQLAEVLCQGRIVSLLEGGYHLQALANSVVHHLRALMGKA